MVTCLGWSCARLPWQNRCKIPIFLLSIAGRSPDLQTRPPPWAALSVFGYRNRRYYGVVAIQLATSRCPPDIAIYFVRFPSCSKTEGTHKGCPLFWSRVRESNPPPRLGKRNSGFSAIFSKTQKVLYYQCIFRFQWPMNFENFQVIFSGFQPLSVTIA